MATDVLSRSKFDAARSGLNSFFESAKNTRLGDGDDGTKE